MKERCPLSLKAANANVTRSLSSCQDNCFEGYTNKVGDGAASGSSENGGAAPLAGLPFTRYPSAESAHPTRHVFQGYLRRRRTRTNRRLYSRVLMGLAIPGRYYFLTLTSSPDSPPLKRSWNAWRMWLKRYRPGVSWCYCFTDEGECEGVVHMVVRLGMRQKMMKQKELSEAWSRIHKAPFVWIRPVRSGSQKSLADYISDQRRLRKNAAGMSGIGNEMSYQQTITRWRWSKGWIPQGLTAKFGRVYSEYCRSDVSKYDRESAIRAWIQKEHLKEVKNV